VISARVASSRSSGKATGRNIVINAESLLKEKNGEKETENIRRENDGLRTKLRILSVELADSSDLNSTVRG
jgi:hypothetical protein